MSRRFQHRTRASPLALVLALAVASPLLAGCGSEAAPATPDVPGELSVDAGVLGATLSIPVKEIWVRVEGTTARGERLGVWVPTALGGAGRGIAALLVPVGSYRVSGVAFSSGAQRWIEAPDFLTLAPLDATVYARQVTTVALVLQQNTAKHPPGAVHNLAPVIEGIVASVYALDAGGSPELVQLAARASDPNGGALSLSWTATYSPPLGATAPGTFAAASTLATTYTPPSGYEGTITLTLAACDVLGARSSLSIVLRALRGNGVGGLLAVVTVNRWPDVAAISVREAQLAPSAVTTLAVSARDADGDPLTYRWDDGGCGGSFTPATGTASTYHAPATETACVLTARVTDGRGGSSASTVTVNVRRPPGLWAPDFLFASQAPANPVAPGAQVAFRADAMEPDGAGGWLPLVTPLAWSDGAGGAFTPAGTGGDRVTWLAPGCQGATGDRPVTVTVTAYGSGYAHWPTDRTVFTFPVVVSCP